MGNVRVREPKELKIVDAYTAVTAKTSAIGIGSGGDPTTSITYHPINADIISILYEINLGSIIIQRQQDATGTGSWHDYSTVVADGCGSLVIDTSTHGAFPNLRLIGSSGPAAAGGSVVADVYWWKKN